MARLGMNFAPARSSEWIRLGILLMLGAGVLIALQARAHLIDASADIEAASERLLRADSHKVVSHLSEVDPKALAAAGQVVVALGRPWEPMLDELQRVTTNELLLSQVQPAADGKVLVSGRSDSSQAFIAFVKRLRQQSRWSDVVPVSEVTGPPDISGKPVTFQLIAEYRAHE